MSKTNKIKLLATNPIVGSLHDALLDANRGNVVEAFEDAVLWLAELEAQRRELVGKVSAGFIRMDTSSLKWKPKPQTPPVDDGSWVETGREDDD